MEKKQPILSFCIPTWNRAVRVFNTVTHILKCQDDRIEVVVSDNHSDDNTLELLKTIDDRRLKLFTNTENISSYNFPLAVSRASGKWAALMSDEDVVVLENIPYFLELLTDSECNNIGAVIYSLRPKWHHYNYYPKDEVESFAYAASSAGHITCHILNMKYFKPLENEDYAWADPELPRTEPQFEILLNILQNPFANRIVITKKGLCDFGKIESYKPKDIPSGFFDVNIFGGESPEYRKIGFEALIKRADVFKNDKRIIALLFIPLKRYIATTVGTMSKVLTTTENHQDRAFMWQAMRQYYGTEQTKINNYCVKHMHSLIDIVRKNTGFDFSACGHCVQKSIQNEFETKIPDMSYLFRILTGNILSSVTPGLYCKYGDKMFEKVGMTENVLEFMDTEKMYEALKNENYDYVINYKELHTHRALYLRGQAHLFKGNLYEALNYFQSFIAVVENPKTLADIITGTMSIVYTYYYLGFINQQRGNINESVKHFSKCYELTDALMVGEKLNAECLGLGKIKMNSLALNESN